MKAMENWIVKLSAGGQTQWRHFIKYEENALEASNLQSQEKITHFIYMDLTKTFTKNEKEL